MNLQSIAKKSMAIVLAGTFLYTGLFPIKPAVAYPNSTSTRNNVPEGSFLAASSLFERLGQSEVIKGHLISTGALLRQLLNLSTTPDQAIGISLKVQTEVEKIGDILSADGVDHRVRVMRASTVLNSDGSVEFVLEHRRDYRPEKVAIKYLPAKADRDGRIEKSADPQFIAELMARAANASDQRAIEYDNFSKGEHVDHTYLSDTEGSWRKTSIDEVPQGNAFIREAVKLWKDKNETAIANLLTKAYSQHKIYVVDFPENVSGSPWTVYSSCYRRMRYAFIYTMDDRMYIPRPLLEIFLNPTRMEQELKAYVGDDNYAKIMAGASLRDRLIGAVGHDAFEGVEALRLEAAFDLKTAHTKANQKEQLVAGRSVVSPTEETGFDDVAKLLLLKSRGMIPSLQAFDILRDHIKDYSKTESYASVFDLVGLRDIDSNNVKQKLEIVFGEPLRGGERYYVLSQKFGENRHALAFVKRKKDGEELIIPVYKDVVPAMNVSVATLVNDYKFFKVQASVPKEKRYFLAFMGKDFTEGGKDDVDLLGGKGSSLAEMARKVPVPAGVTATAKAYYKFLDANPELKEFLQEKMASIDVKNNTERGKLAREIQERMSKAVIPDEIINELAIYYRHLNLIKGNTNFNTPVADRTSGVLEDIAAELPWFKHTSGSQAGQGDTYLNVKTIDNVAEKLRGCWLSLFTDRAISYRDDQWFLMLAGELGQDGYTDLASRLRAKGLTSIADAMTRHESPGYLNLKTVVHELLAASPDDEKIKSYVKAVDKTADLFINPEKLGIAVVVMNMVKSEWAFVAFTVSAVTGFAGKDLAKWLAGHGDDRFVRRDKSREIRGTKPMVVQVESNWGYGETVVGGMVTPDKAVVATLDGENWFVLERDLGTKIYRMIDIEDGFRLLSDQMPEKRVRALAEKVKDLVAFAENNVHIAKLVKTNSDLMGRLINPSGDRKKDQKRIEDLAKELAPLAEKEDAAGMRAKLAEHFGVDVDGVITAIIGLVKENKVAAERGQKALESDLGASEEVVDAFKKMVLAVWGNENMAEIKDMRATPDAVFRALRLGDTEHFRQMVWLFRSLKEGTFTTIMDTPESLRNKFTFPGELLAHVASLAQSVGDHYEDDRDLEGAAEVVPGGEIKTDLFDLEGRTAGQGTMENYNLQARPYTAKTVDTDVRRDVFVVDEGFVEKHGIQTIATGAKGESAARGMIYVVDDTRDLGEQADEIAKIMKERGWNKSTGEGVIALIKFATPAHDPIMKIVAATVTYEGGETSHAAIFNREQGNPCIAGIGRPTGAAAAILHEGNSIVVDANNGKIYEDKEYEGKKIPVDRETIIIKPYLIPFEEGDPQSGMILAGTNMAQIVSPLTGSTGHYGNSLARMEFGIQAMGIYPTAAVAYDNHVALQNRETTMENLTAPEQADVKELRRHPKVIEDIKAKIAGYPTASEYVISKMEYIYNTLGFCIAPNQQDIARAYDNKENEVIGELIGADLYVHPGENPLIEVRGSSLMVKPESQKPFGLLLEGLFRSIKHGLTNHGWMDVFVRTERELEQLLKQLDEMQQKYGVRVKNVGIMVEVPSNAFIINRLGDLLANYRQNHPGVKMFFSFGTNDYTNLAGKTDRDDPAVQALQIKDPAIKKVTFSDGSNYERGPKGQLIIPLADEGSPVVQRMIETVVAEAIKQDIACGLCGQAIVKLIEYGNYLGAARIISVLNSFGTDIKNYVMANMVRYDAMSRLKKIDPSAVLPAEKFSLGSKTQDAGIVSGEIVFVDSPEDLLSDELRGLSDDKKTERVRFLRDNDPAKLSRVGNKIVVLTGNLGSAEALKKAGIEYIDLQYARAIIVDESVDLSASDVFDKVKEKIILSRVKATAKDLAGLRDTLQGTQVTIDYASGKVYGGIVPVIKEKVKPRILAIPEQEADVPSVEAKEVSANDIFRDIGIHPLALLAYDSGDLEGEDFKQVVFTNLKEEYKAKKEAKTDDEIIGEAAVYLSDLKTKIAAEISGYPSATEYMKARLNEAMLAAAQANSKELVVYRISNLTRKDFSRLQGGKLERLNENPGYGLLGAARSISDFWKIYRLELQVLKQVRGAGNKNLGLMISDLRGVRSGAVLNGHMQVIRDEGLVPGQDGFEVGVNIASISDVLSADGYAQEGITFVVFEERPLAGALFGANLARQKDIGITEEEIKGIVVDPRKMVKAVAQARGLKWVAMPVLAAAPLRVPVEELPPIFGPAVAPVPAGGALRSSGGFDVMIKPISDHNLVESAL